MRLVDLSHPIEHGMETFPGLPAPVICDFWTRESTVGKYRDGATFHIGRIDMVANTGTYLDAPFHRYAGGKDIAALELPQLADLPLIVVRAQGQRGVDVAAFAGLAVAGCAVLVHTGHDRHWRTPAYAVDHPFLTAAAAAHLRDAGARLVGIDSVNIDDMTSGMRPVHTLLLGADIPIVEHLCNLGAVPDTGARFSAVPAPVRGLGTFPVRAYARLP